MEPGPPDSKRLRLSAVSPPWPAGPSSHVASLLHPTPSPTSQHPQQPHPMSHHPNAPVPYQQPSHPSHPFSRPAEQPQPLPPQLPPQLPMQPPVDDRRHHESDRLPPMQDHRQHPQSPAHPPFSNYPPREPIVKTDPEDTLPQLRRPHSTGTAPDVSASGQSSHPGMGPQSYPSDKRHMSFDGAPQQSPVYRQPSYPPPTPTPQPQSYEYPPPTYGHPPPEMQFSIPISSSGKRKAQRASQACDNCRALKAKCDELKPCKSCKEKKVECVYRETAPKQQDKVAAEILDHLVMLRSEVASVTQRLSNLERQQQQHGPQQQQQQQTQHLSRLKQESPVAQYANDPMQEEEDGPRSASSPAAGAEDAYSSPDDTLAGIQGSAALLEAQQQDQQLLNVDEDKEDEPGPHVRPGKPAIPVGHTTLAAFLLKWRSIEKLVRHVLDAEGIKFIDEFPIRQEEKRGLLRVWGRGEGQDNGLFDREGTQDHGTLEVRDDYSDTGASSPAAPSPNDCWGTIGGSPSPAEGRPVPNPVTSLDLNHENVWKYVKSYEDNIQNMHPLIIPRNLKSLVKSFEDQATGRVRGSSTTGGTNHAMFVQAAPPPPQEAGAKRKRSPGPEGVESGPTRRPGFQRSVSNAVVLMVLALGKICLVKDRKIPNVVQVNEPTHASPLVRNGHPASPSQSSPPSYTSHSHSSGLPSPKDSTERVVGRGSRRASLQGATAPVSLRSGASAKRNIDVIPGLDYCGYALDIIGSQWAGRSLSHVHFHILAGLYYGQLGRVMDSYAHIKEAGWALHSNMRRKFDRFRRLQEQVATISDDLDNQIMFAFWTCLQLESDIIAELPLPHSPILAYEEMMPYPSAHLAKHYGFSEYVLQSYLAQLYLRKKLNQIHQILYHPDEQIQLQVTDQTVAMIEELEKSLDQKFIPWKFKFHPNDRPANDILAARLRAKYWGAQVITYRPFIRMILESNFDAATGSAPAQDFSDVVIGYAGKGLRALIESTRAFHGLGEQRFIITNVFGTAHAQWGNLLTLAAAFKDPTLTRHIEEHVLKELFKKTIAFFDLTSQPSSALAIDRRILFALRQELWKGEHNEVDMRAGSSFSSNTSHAAPVPTTPSAPLPPMTEHTPGTPMDLHTQ